MAQSAHSPQPLLVRLNGMPVETAQTTLEMFLIEHGYGEQKIATAVNSVFVPSLARSSTVLSAGDCIEVVSARQGG